MKAGWEVRQLGEVCTVVNGGTPKSHVPSYWGGDVNWLTPKDMGQMQGDYIAETPRKITQEGLSNSSARTVPPHSVIMSTRAPIGHLAINEAPMAFNQGCRGMVPDKHLNARYLFHFLSANTEQLNDLGTGTTFKELSSSALKAFPVPLPPLEEQQRIVAVLDEAFEGLTRARAHAEANLQNARELFSTVLDDAFAVISGDNVRFKLEDIVEITHGFAFKSDDFSTSSDATRPIILTPGNYSEDACLHFSTKNTKRLRGNPPLRYLFEVGELTIVMTDLSPKMNILGQPAFIEQANILHNQRIGRVRFKSDAIAPRLLFHFLRSEHARKSIRDTATGTMVRHTAPKRILNLEMTAPRSKVEQEDLVGKLDHVERAAIELRRQYNLSISSIETLRQSLLQRAFAGELT